MDRNIRFLRGTAANINKNKQNKELAAGQPLYNATDKYLTVGGLSDQYGNTDRKLDTEPITVRKLHGNYTNIIANGVYDYRIEPNTTDNSLEIFSKSKLKLYTETEDVDISSGKLLKINASEDINVESNQDITITANNSDINLNGVIIDKDGNINQIGKLSDLVDDDTTKPTTIVAAINEVRQDLNNTIQNLDVAEPAANGTATAFIATAKQENGKLVVTKKNLPTASINNTGIVQLSNSTSSNSAITAATSLSVKTVNDRIDDLDYSSPSVPTSGTRTAIEFIDTISQTNGKISATKKSLPTASSSAAGITKLGVTGGAATYEHTHQISLATDTGNSNITLAHGSKYKLTAGGTSIIFTMPSDNDTTYSFGTGYSQGQYKVGSTSYNVKGLSTTSSPTFSAVTASSVTASTFTATSDKRLKENITPFKIEKSILDLPVYKYNFISDESKKEHIGCLAQDLQEICPEIVNTDDKGYLSIQENKIIYLLLEEVKKLKEEIKSIKK